MYLESVSSLANRLASGNNPPFARTTLHRLAAELTARACSLAAGASFGPVFAGGITPNLLDVSSDGRGESRYAHLLPSAFVAGA